MPAHSRPHNRRTVGLSPKARPLRLHLLTDEDLDERILEIPTIIAHLYRNIHMPTRQRDENKHPGVEILRHQGLSFKKKKRSNAKKRRKEIAMVEVHLSKVLEGEPYLTTYRCAKTVTESRDLELDTLVFMAQRPYVPILYL